MLLDLPHRLSGLQTLLQMVDKPKHLEKKLWVDGTSLVVLHPLGDEVVDDSLVLGRLLTFKELYHVQNGFECGAGPFRSLSFAEDI
jgi:hypothetical protein